MAFLWSLTFCLRERAQNWKKETKKKITHKHTNSNGVGLFAVVWYSWCHSPSFCGHLLLLVSIMKRICAHARDTNAKIFAHQTGNANCLLFVRYFFFRQQLIHRLNRIVRHTEMTIKTYKTTTTAPQQQQQTQNETTKTTFTYYHNYLVKRSNCHSLCAYHPPKKKMIRLKTECAGRKKEEENNNNHHQHHKSHSDRATRMWTPKIKFYSFYVFCK